MLLRKLLPAILLLDVLLFTGPLAWADAADHYNRVTFQSIAAREVPNDLLVARMSIEINDKQPAPIARKMTSVLNAALKTAEAYPAVKAANGDQNTEAVYNRKNQLIGYRGHAELRLESRDFVAASQLIAKLQKTMQLAGMDFSVAPETRRQTEDALLAEAENDYKKNAQAVSVLLNGSGYKLVNQVVNQGGDNTSIELMQGMVDNMRNKEFKPLNLAGGKSEIRVQIISTIEITP